MVESLCAPALIFLILTTIQIFIDIFKKYYNQAFFKFIGMILITLLLNILCKKGLGIVAWMLVFIPFILMTLISVILVVVFGLNPAEGDYTVNIDESNNNEENEENEQRVALDNISNTNQNTSNNTNCNKTCNNNSNKIISISPQNNSNTNEKNIYIYSNGEYEEGMLNYSVFNSDNKVTRRGNLSNNTPNTPETTSVDKFYKNMFGKLI